jgi:hypothetical protein
MTKRRPCESCAEAWPRVVMRRRSLANAKMSLKLSTPGRQTWSSREFRRRTWAGWSCVADGVGALVSLTPNLQSDTLRLCLGILHLIALASLRGQCVGSHTTSTVSAMGLTSLNSFR